MSRTPRLILNGERPEPEELRMFIIGISDPGRLRASGGYLFKTGLAREKAEEEKRVLIAICPAISEGLRLYHYDIDVADPDHIIGTISATGVFTLIFKVQKKILDDKERKHWRNRFVAFATALMNAGYQGVGSLDWITRSLLDEMGIFEAVPRTLAQMAQIVESGRSSTPVQ